MSIYNRFAATTVAVAAILLLSVSSAWAAWYVKWSCPGCSKIGARTSGTEGPYSSRSACESARSRANASQGVSVGSCYQRGGSSSGSSGYSGGMSTGDPVFDAAMPIMQGVFDSIGQGIANSLFGNPQEEARQRREREEAARRAAEAAQRRAAEEARRREAEHQELLSDLMPGPQGTSPSASAPLPPLTAALLPNAGPSSNTAPHQKGLYDASNCYPFNAFGFCVSVDQSEYENCTKDYRAGFAEGEEYQQGVMRLAFNQGKFDGEYGNKNGKPNVSFNHPKAVGGCRNEWIRTYNRGHFQEKSKTKGMVRRQASIAEQVREPVRDALKNKDSKDNLVQKEQDEFERMNAAWLRKQQELIQQAVEGDKKWTNEVFSAIKQIRVPELDRPSTLKDLKPGDIILVSPDKESLISRAIPTGDQLIRAANHLAEGKVFEAATTEKIPVSHSVAFVKSVGGKRLYLDHTWDDGRSRILDEREFQKRYGNRLQYLARPKAPIDGKRLWEVAREAALKGTRYGVIGEGDAVCSEVDKIAIVKASGKRLHLEGKKLNLVDFTPADFYDKKTNGKYFIVSPLKNEP